MTCLAVTWESWPMGTVFSPNMWKRLPRSQISRNFWTIYKWLWKIVSKFKRTALKQSHCVKKTGQHWPWRNKLTLRMRIGRNNKEFGNRDQCFISFLDNFFACERKECFLHSLRENGELMAICWCRCECGTFIQSFRTIINHLCLWPLAIHIRVDCNRIIHFICIAWIIHIVQQDYSHLFKLPRLGALSISKTINKLITPANELWNHLFIGSID